MSSKLVLVLNCGSSSLKFAIIDAVNGEEYLSGLAECFHLPEARIKWKMDGNKQEAALGAGAAHSEALNFIVNTILAQKPELSAQLTAIGHRIVHGGEKFASSAIITDEMIKAVEECNDLAPLHNPANLIGIRVCSELMPNVPQVGVFDTAFHQTMPAKAYLYGLPIEYYKNYKVRRYGFHGTSHSFVSKRAVEFLGLDKDNSKVIVCHLGNGSSISAVQNGKCVDTTMGLTPLEGVVMGTRSGSIDPAIVEYIAKKENLDLAGVMNVLNKKSGLQGMSGVSSDMRDLRAAAAEGNEDAKNAIEVLCYGIAKYVGGYVAAMNGVDAIVFTAGIGENVGMIREKVCSYLGFLGVTIDAKANEAMGEEVVISGADSKVKVAVIPTNEELAICRDTVALVK